MKDLLVSVKGFSWTGSRTSLDQLTGHILSGSQSLPPVKIPVLDSKKHAKGGIGLVGKVTSRIDFGIALLQRLIDDHDIAFTYVRARRTSQLGVEPDVDR